MGSKASSQKSSIVPTSEEQDMNWIVLEAGDIQKEWDALLQNALLQTCAGEKILLPNLEMLVNKSNILCKEIDHTTTALHVACRKNNLQAVRVLLDAGTSANSRDECGATALHQMSSLFSHNKITSMYSFFLLIFRLKDLTTGIKCVFASYENRRRLQ